MKNEVILWPLTSSKIIILVAQPISTDCGPPDWAVNKRAELGWPISRGKGWPTVCKHGPRLCSFTVLYLMTYFRLANEKLLEPFFTSYRLTTGFRQRTRSWSIKRAKIPTSFGVPCWRKLTPSYMGHTGTTYPILDFIKPKLVSKYALK